jgi:hypothetical protein
MTPNRLGGVLLGVVGVAVMIGPGALGGVAINVLGQAAILGAAICYDCAGIFGRRFLSLPPMVAATGQVTTATVMVLPFALFIDRPWAQPMPGMAAWVAIASAGARLCAVFPHPGHRQGDQPSAGDLDHARRRGVSWHAILGEQIRAGDFCGMVLIGLGLTAIDGRPLAWFKLRSQSAIFERRRHEKQT